MSPTMLRSVVSALLLGAALAGCSPSSINTRVGAREQRIDVLAEGGYAPMRTRHIVSRDDRSFVYSNRRLCERNCGAPLDSASGTVSAAAADSLFAVIFAQDPFSLSDDYGTTRGGADMSVYTVRITADGRAKSIRFD